MKLLSTLPFLNPSIIRTKVTWTKIGRRGRNSSVAPLSSILIFHCFNVKDSHIALRARIMFSFFARAKPFANLFTLSHVQSEVLKFEKKRSMLRFLGGICFVISYQIVYALIFLGIDLSDPAVLFLSCTKIHIRQTRASILIDKSLQTR